jgi:hypothetical protein
MYLKPVIYIAGPFRAPSTAMPGQQNSWGIHQNVTRAMELSLQVWGLGAVGLCPHGNTFCFQNALSDDIWLEGDLALLAKCDAVIVTPDWERSSGARAEVKFAEDHGIPVFATLPELARWVDGHFRRWLRQQPKAVTVGD